MSPEIQEVLWGVCLGQMLLRKSLDFTKSHKKVLDEQARRTSEPYRSRPLRWLLSSPDP